MKRMMFMAAAMAAALGFAEARTAEQIYAEYTALTTAVARAEYAKTVTTGEWRTVAEGCLTAHATNRNAAVERFVGDMFFNEFLAADNATALASEYDAKFAAAGMGYPIWLYEKAPLCGENYLASTNNAKWVGRHPLYIRLARERKSGVLNFRKDNVSIPELANLIVEDAADTSFSNAASKNQGLVLKRIPSVIKRIRRKNGLPITVQPDGTNPVQQEVDRFTAALNAPRMAGLKEWIADYFPEYTWTDVQMYSDAEVAKLKDDVFYGEVPFNGERQKALKFYLGVTEYNKFVKEYNTEQ